MRYNNTRQAPKGYLPIKFDIMLNGMWKGTETIYHCPLFVLDTDKITRVVEEKYPELKGKHYTIEFCK